MTRTDVSEDDAVLGGGHLDARFDVCEVVRTHRHGRRLLNQLQVA